MTMLVLWLAVAVCLVAAVVLFVAALRLEHQRQRLITLGGEMMAATEQAHQIVGQYTGKLEVSLHDYAEHQWRNTH